MNFIYKFIYSFYPYFKINYIYKPFCTTSPLFKFSKPLCRKIFEESRKLKTPLFDSNVCWFQIIDEVVPGVHP